MEDFKDKRGIVILNATLHAQPRDYKAAFMYLLRPLFSVVSTCLNCYPFVVCVLTHVTSLVIKFVLPAGICCATFIQCLKCTILHIFSFRKLLIKTVVTRQLGPISPTGEFAGIAMPANVLVTAILFT